MGIVLKQSFRNTLILILGFAIGGINVLFLYTHFLADEYYGLVIFLLSTSVILLPLLVFGMQHAVVKYFSSFKEKSQQDSLLTWSLVLPLLVSFPIGCIGFVFYENIATVLSVKNEMIKDYTYLIFLTAIFMGYFEVFYAWTKVQLNSVFGNFIKEIFARVGATLLLVAVYFDWLTPDQFVYGIVIVYFLRMSIMKLYAYSIYFPRFTFKRPSNFKEILQYSMYLIMAGSAGSILLEIDKFMIPQVEELPELAYYAVGVFIASTIGIPNRAMQQIASPIIAKDINNNDLTAVSKLYKQSSINLLIVGGLLFLLINLNITDIYQIIGKPQYSVGVWIVFFISISELYKLSLGTNGLIITNSKYYRVFFYISVLMALTVVVLNHIFIRMLGIDGAALATLVTVLIFNTVRILYIQRKMDVQPYSKETVLVFLLIMCLFGMFYFIKIPFVPIVNIAIKSIVIGLLYALFVYRFKLSMDINDLVNGFLKKN